MWVVQHKFAAMRSAAMFAGVAVNPQDKQWHAAAKNGVNIRPID